MALEDAKTQVDTAFTRNSHRGYSYENAFGGATSFLRRTYTKDLTGVDLAITGVPFDQAVSHRAGTRFGPRAIREGSADAIASTVGASARTPAAVTSWTSIQRPNASTPIPLQARAAPPVGRTWFVPVA